MSTFQRGRLARFGAGLMLLFLALVSAALDGFWLAHFLFWLSTGVFKSVFFDER